MENKKITTIENLAILIQEEFLNVNKRFDKIDQRLNKLEEKE